MNLITLADLPELARGERRATIIVARLDDRLRDPRYGKFAITQEDVDGWKRNLAETFGGQVSIDFDHSSDRGGGTRAAAWITGLGQSGKLVTADVEFTPRGAKAVRRGDYRYISPTFVSDFKDEHGESRGRALIGAALTNRPVLRKGMPTLSLSRDHIEGAAVPGKTKKKIKKQKRLLSKKAIRALSAFNPGLKFDSPEATHASLLAEARRIAQAHRTWPALPGARVPADRNRVPFGVDQAGQQLHQQITQTADRDGTDYWTAFAKLSPGNAEALQRNSDFPPGPIAPMDGAIPERSAVDMAARHLAKAAGISYLDAVMLIEHHNDGTELAQDDGASDTPWLDSRPLPIPPKPWSDPDWERDKRRAHAAGVDIDRDAWQAGAELGHDVVGELADEKRTAALDAHRQQGADLLNRARHQEDARRAAAINDELLRRARSHANDLAERLRRGESTHAPSDPRVFM